MALKCEICGKEDALPFVCNYCGGVFCSDHRLPESHNCKGDLTKRPVVVQQPRTSSWQGTSYTSTARPGRTIFSPREVRDIVLAWLALGLAFFLSTNGGLSFLAQLSIRGGTSLLFLESFGVSLLTVGTGFVLHELMHKFTAERYGFWAEFRMWPFGILLALVTSMIGFIFAAPGATYISGETISTRENGIISLAGPATNIVVGVFFLPFLLYGQGILGRLGNVGLSINLFLALFNMLPLLPLDGAKVFGWSKPIWAIVFVPLLLVLVTVFLR